MTYREYNDHLKVCQFLGREPVAKFKKIHDHLTGIFDGLECEVDSRFNHIILQKEDKWIMYQDCENECLWCQRKQVWSFFEKDMGMNPTDTKGFIKTAVEEHLKCEVGTPFFVGE